MFVVAGIINPFLNSCFQLAYNPHRLPPLTTQGERFRRELRGLNSPIIQEVRGKGLLNAVVIEDRSTDQSYAWDVCVRLADMGEYYM